MSLGTFDCVFVYRFFQDRYISIYVYLWFKFIYLCVHKKFGKVHLPVQYLWSPFKALQSTVMQSSASMCDLIVSWPRETEHPDKAGSTYVTFITVKRKYGSTKVGSKGGIRKTL